MPRKPKKQPSPSKHGQATKATPDPKPLDKRQLHGRAIPGGIYRALLSPMLGDQLDKERDSSVYAQSVIAEMAPRDAVEEMLISQMLFTHARVMRLTMMSHLQSGVESLRAANECADRASNTYRRLALALAEYRRPRRAGGTFAVVQQANIAGQQVIQNHENSNKNATIEQGCTGTIDGSNSASASPSVLPTNAGGAVIPSFIRPAGETLGAVHGTADAGRKSSLAAERNQAR